MYSVVQEEGRKEGGMCILSVCYRTVVGLALYIIHSVCVCMYINIHDVLS